MKQKPPSRHPTAHKSRQLNELAIMNLTKKDPFDMEIHQFYHFNFHEENLPSYKNDLWLFFNEALFIKA